MQIKGYVTETRNFVVSRNPFPPDDKWGQSVGLSSGGSHHRVDHIADRLLLTKAISAALLTQSQRNGRLAICSYIAYYQYFIAFGGRGGIRRGFAKSRGKRGILSLDSRYVCIFGRGRLHFDQQDNVCGRDSGILLVMGLVHVLQQFTMVNIVI